MTASMALSMRGPSKPPAPVSGVSTPSCSFAPWARAIRGSAAPAASAPPPARTVRRDGWGRMRVIGSLLGCRCSGAQEQALDVGIGGQRRGRTTAAVAAVDQAVGAGRVRQRLACVLLYHRGPLAPAVDCDDSL